MHNHIRLVFSHIIHFSEKTEPGFTPMYLQFHMSLLFCAITCFFEISRKPQRFTIQASASQEKNVDLLDPLLLQSHVCLRGEQQCGSVKLEHLTHQLYFDLISVQLGKYFRD